jgi:DNA-binding transcriptional ArsR family regulator
MHPETIVLRALSSPVRQEILGHLAQAPATSAMLARSLGSNTGVTSYHLRELGKAGLIEPDAQQGRALYWRLTHTDVRFNDPQVSAQPQLAEAAIDLTLARFNASVRSYLGRTDLDPAWRDAALFSQSAVALTEGELAEFAEAYLTLVRRWTAPRPAPAGALPVRLALFAFPESAPSSSDGETDGNLDR